MRIETQLTRRLGLRIPVIQGGMQWVGYAELASAVSNAGGLGMITALTQSTPELLREEIRKCKKMTPNVFGVNLTLLPSLRPPNYQAYARVVVEEGIRVVETAGNRPEEVIRWLRGSDTSKSDIVVIHKCTTIKHALAAQKLGADFISIDGMECAGHVGENNITNLVLLNKARQTLRIGYIGSGGFADGYGLAAALALGAQGISMGTRFMSTIEAPIHKNIKLVILNSDETQTALVLKKWKNTTRLYKNNVVQEVLRIEEDSKVGDDFAKVANLMSGQRGRQVFTNGDPEFGVWTVGQVMGVIHDIPSCKALLDRVESEALSVISKLNDKCKPDHKI